MPEQTRVEVAVVSKAHGIKGEIVAIPHDPDSTSLADVATVWIGDRSYKVVRARPLPPSAFLLQLEGLSDRDVAAGLRGQTISVDRDELALDDDEVLLADLVGCQTRLPDGTPWGEVVGVELGGMQDRLVIHHEGMERLLPVVDAFIADIDLDAGVVVITPPDGMPEEPIS
ncbi:MAG TPA: ribosome maturation factor RimM [Kofleriaceae bacterium]|jgi:16S rRNA processing protein RimM|nr:ribosome maturation factor RimM [Kofleriaceae bacterium]